MVISDPQKSEKRNRKTNKLKKTCASFCNFRELKFAIYLEGGLLIVPQKYHEASEFVYNSGFFITTNKYPNFGEGRDGEAIKRRLEIF